MQRIKSTTREEKIVARGFCEFLYKVRVNDTFTLWNLQGDLRFVNAGIPSEQTYVEHLRVATEEGWVQHITSEPNTYRRIGHKRSAYGRGELQMLKDKIICSLDGREWID